MRLVNREPVPETAGPRVRRIAGVLRAVQSGTDLSDVFFVVGVGLIGIGAWFIYPPAMFLVVGVILTAVGIAGMLTGRR